MTMNRQTYLVITGVAMILAFVAGWSVRAGVARTDAESLRQLYQADNMMLMHDIQTITWTELTLRSLERGKPSLAIESLQDNMAIYVKDIDKLLSSGARPNMLLVNFSGLERAREHGAEHGLTPETLEQLDRSLATLRSEAKKQG